MFTKSYKMNIKPIKIQEGLKQKDLDAYAQELE
jgi:hypothetical protein